MGVPIATGALKTMRTNVVAGGSDPVAADRRGVSGHDTGASQHPANADSPGVLLWADSLLCDADRVDNFYKLQQLAFRAYMMNGDAFAVLPMRHNVGRSRMTCGCSSSKLTGCAARI